MPDRLPCEFFLIRYVPDPVKGEFVNIGVLLREADRPRQAQVQFTRDWTRVRCMHADADINLLEALESEIDERLRLEAASPDGVLETRPVLSVLEDTLSNSVQISGPRACLAENVTTELELLMRLHVEPLRVKQDRRRTGRAAIATTMRLQFERAGVWPLMRKRIACALYTQPGDPMKLDCGYRRNGVIRIFHAVSLEFDAEAAKILAWSAPRLRAGIHRVEFAALDLAAVVEPLPSIVPKSRPGKQKTEISQANQLEQTTQLQTKPEESGDGEHPKEASEFADGYRFAIAAMEQEGIRVLTLNDLARSAASARIELNV